MYPSNLIRKKFLDYFNKRKHSVVNSSSLIPNNDPTLIFTNSGMVQFKNIFTGLEKSKLKRAVTSQKCVRAGGKHNDLNNVGHTYRHHTFFEMLGNFSFGDYFKEEAIAYAWDLLINEFKIDKKKILITTFFQDNETLSVWKKISGFKDDKIIPIKSNDNFWSMGETGPCGPCTEIFYDYGDLFKGTISKNGVSGDRYVEIWNLVFMEFNQINKNKRIDLPKKCVDTGMGLERISSVLQGTHDNYETDLFKKIISLVAKLSNSKKDINKNLSYKIIADHMRSSSHLIADGVTPSNEGRGYVLRRIMRRGMRHAHILGCQDPIFYQIAPLIIEDMGSIYPELKRAKSLIIQILRNEETRFRETIDRGLKILNNEIKKTKNNIFSGDAAFNLYDTYGFPLDLTEDILKDIKMSVDIKEFNKKMEAQRKRARSSWKGSGDKKTDRIWFKVFEKFGPTEFIGYENIKSQGKILEIIKKNNFSQNVLQDEEAIIITNQTPFYAESGGQIGDTGFIKIDNNKFKVIDTKKILKIHLHIGKVLEGRFVKNQTVNMIIEKEKRDKVRNYHSATHLLHAALRKILGNHVTQKGSLVASDRLRFDFSHTESINLNEIKKIEDTANKIINQNDDVYTTIMPYKDAIQKGAMALFGEKYEDEVRVVSMGNQNIKSFFSMELCGGTHVEKTSSIKKIKIIKQSAVASGIRRIEALCGQDLTNFIKDEKKISQIEEKKIDYKKKEEELEKKEKIKSLKDKKKNIIKEGTENSIKYYFRTIIDFPPNNLPDLVDKSKKDIESGVVVFFSEYKKSISIVVGVTSDLTQKINAVDIAKKCADVLDGKGGGGRADFARAGGGNNSKKIPRVYDVILNLLNNI